MEEALQSEYSILELEEQKIINQIESLNEKEQLGYTLSSQTQAMVDYYWQNEASLSDCEKADLLYDIADRLLNVDYEDTVDVWEYEQGLANDLYDYVENDQYHFNMYTTLLQNSYDDVEEYEDLVEYYTYYGNQQMVEMYEALISLEQNYYQPMHQSNITYWQGVLATDQAIYDAQQAIADAADQAIDDIIDLWVYYEDLWLTYYMLCSGRAQIIMGKEYSEMPIDFQNNKIQFISQECKLSEQLFNRNNQQLDTEKIDTVNQLIPIIKELLIIKTQEQVNFTNIILEIKIQLSTKKGEILAKQKAVNYFSTLDSNLYSERITQYNQNLLTIQYEYDQLSSLLFQQNLINDLLLKNIYTLQSQFAWLESELLKLQSQYGSENGKYGKLEFPTSFSESEYNQTIIDEQFALQFYKLANIGDNTSARIVTTRKIIQFIEKYIANITLMTNQFKQFIQLIESSQSRFDKMIKQIEYELELKTTELNQNIELKDYYSHQDMQDKAQKVEENLVIIRGEIEALQKNLASIQLSSQIYTNSIDVYNSRINFRSNQLSYLDGQLQQFKFELEQLESGYYSQQQQQQTNTSYSASESAEVAQIDDYINEIANQEIDLNKKILKITKIVTMIKSQIVLITQKKMQIKYEVQKLIAKQFKIKLQIGIYQAQYDSYQLKIKRLEQEIAEFTGSPEQLAKLKAQLALYKQQSDNAWNQIQTLTITYDEIQKQIDNYLMQENTYSEQLVKYKEQLINYQGQLKDLNIEQQKLEEEELAKKKEKQRQQQENLERYRRRIQNMKDQIDDKRSERDEACRIPQEPEPVQQEEIIEEQNENPHEEKEKRSYNPLSWDDEDEKPKEYQPRIDGAQKGFDEHIPGNPYIPPKQRPEEEIWSKPKTDKRYDFGWEQFEREKEEEKKNRNLTLAQPEEKIVYNKENFDEGIYRIKRRLHDIMNYQFGNDEFFVHIKQSVEHYLKVLVEKEQIIKKKEITIKERTIKIENNERRIEHKAEIIKQDLVKCQLDFPKIREKAQKIKSQNYTEQLEKKIQEKIEELKQQQEENKKAEEELHELDIKVEEDQKQAEIREEKLAKSYPNEFHYDSTVKNYHPLREGAYDEAQSDYIPSQLYKPNIQETAKNIKVPETQEEKQQEQLTQQEEKLDQQLEENEEQVIQVAANDSNEEKIQTTIQNREKEIFEEEKKIEQEKSKLNEEKKRLDQEIEQCKLTYSDEQQQERLSPDEQEQYQRCITNRDEFDQQKFKLESEISKYESLFKDLQEEKTKFQSNKLSINDLTVSGIHTERNNDDIIIPVFAEIKKNVHKQAFWKHISKQLNLVNNLAQSNAKQQKHLENEMKDQRISNKEHLAAIKSIKYIQSFTEKIAAKLNLILSEYPEDRAKLREMTTEVVQQIDKLYELSIKQRRIISQIDVLRQKQRELLTMKNTCLKTEKLLNQPSFIQNLLQMNTNKKRNSGKY